MIQKIITHNGIFHADDVMAVALLHEFIDPLIPVVRTRNITQEDINNPKVWIVDVGGVYDQDLNNYDHHQDSGLPSTCVLVLQELYMWGEIKSVQYDELLDPMLAVSEIDCNGPKADGNSFTFNSLIKSFNSLHNGWDVALETARQYISSRKKTAALTQDSRRIWFEGERISMYIRICNDFPIHWKRYDEEPILVYPHNGKWNVLTVNSECFPLIKCGDENFMHANRFLAVYDDKQKAIDCAQRSAYNAVG
jgi:hypothetical protein